MQKEIKILSLVDSINKDNKITKQMGEMWDSTVMIFSITQNMPIKIEQ